MPKTNANLVMKGATVRLFSCGHWVVNDLEEAKQWCWFCRIMRNVEYTFPVDKVEIVDHG